MYTCTDRQQRQCLAVSEFMYLFLFNLFECDKYSWMYRVWLFQITIELQTVVWDCNNNVAVMLLLWDEEAQAGYLQTVFLCAQTAQTDYLWPHSGHDTQEAQVHSNMSSYHGHPQPTQDRSVGTKSENELTKIWVSFIWPYSEAKRVQFLLVWNNPHLTQQCGVYYAWLSWEYIWDSDVMGVLETVENWKCCYHSLSQSQSTVSDGSCKIVRLSDPHSFCQFTADCWVVNT